MVSSKAYLAAESGSELAAPSADYMSQRMRRARALLRNVIRVNRELEREMLRQMNKPPAALGTEAAVRGKRR